MEEESGAESKLRKCKYGEEIYCSLIEAYYCSVIIAASFSGFIIQSLMVILDVAILVTSFFCLYIEMIHKLEGWKAVKKTKVNLREYLV